MSFITPYFLFGLLGIGIPLLIHLSRREKAPTVVFSTLRFLRKVNRKIILLQRIQQLLLLILRMAVIALLALAFARPVMTGTTAQMTGNTPQSAVLLIDVSMSMQYGDYFQRAKDEALQVLRSLKSGDEAAVITFSDGIEKNKELTTDLALLESFVQSLNSPGYFSTHILNGMRIADQILQKAQYTDKRIYLISDYQTHAFEGLDSSFRLSKGISFHGIKTADSETMNLAVTDVKSPETLSGNKESCVILAHVKNTGNRPLAEARVSLMIDEKIVTTKTVKLENKSEAVVSFTTTVQGIDTQIGAISVNDQSFPPDNSFFFTLSTQPHTRILCVDGEPNPHFHTGESYWFRQALGGHEGSAFNIEVIRHEDLKTDLLEQYDVITLLNAGNFSPVQVDALESYVEKGGNLLLAPADRVEAETFNKLFINLTPASLIQKQIQNEREFLVLSHMNNRHPILQGLLADQSVDFGTARFQGYWHSKPVEGSNIIMGFDNGEAALVERLVDKGRVLIFTSSLDMEWNNLPVHVAYLPLLHEQ